MSNEPNATLDGPAVEEASVVQPRKQGPYKKRATEAAANSFAAYVADLPNPFRPQHLAEAIRIHAAENGIVGQALEKVDPHKFLKEHGLPNPLKRFRIVATRQKETLGPDEFDAVDPSEAARLFAEKHDLKETHQHRFQSFLIDQ